MKEQIQEIFKSKDLKEISIELVEKVLDDQITDEIVKELPILKSIVAVKNVYNSYTDRIFIKKAMNVLLELGDLNEDEKNTLLDDLDDEDESSVEKILMAIDKLENIKKCKVFGRLCKLKAKGEFYSDYFLRLTNLIQTAYIDDLQLIKEFRLNERKEIFEEEYYPLINLGLIFQERSEQTPIERNHQYEEYDPEFKGGEIKFYYRLTDIGEYLYNYYNQLFPEDL
ncbi:MULTISPECIES: hypothetical protein [unclassified Flavobacterium]|jgi:hypothetical protein|uniref:hypothetical protein n=1 Tax=unclassified Flavobacterium TaxID=196869 RepID=UPI00129262E3|nr:MULTISPECIES: hypothetical protein [unclassified Flavobacterium]MQP53278.1 hypothetical protein [Flavobacterium sp. LMO9]MQP63289.1 hypothetical protein [Flavobacterium sp. LMO6]